MTQCKDCGRDNPPEARFCAGCGASLSAAGPSSEAAPLTLEALSRQVQALREEVLQLREDIGRLLPGDRLPAAPSEPVVAAPQEQPAIAVVAQAQPEPAPEPLVPPAPAVEPRAAPVMPAAAPPPPPPAGRPAPREWEEILGGNWLARVGVLAVIVGVAFFLKLAFDNEWIGPVTRVILGIAAGLAMLGLGYFWQKRYPVFAQALTGGGIGLNYLSIFAAFAMFRLIPSYPAIGLLFLISVGSALLALRYDSMALAILGISGAFIAPFILSSPAPQGAPQTGAGFQLLAYVMVVDIGVLVLSTFRNWRWFTLLALFGSSLAYATWNAEYGRRATLLVAEGSLTVIFLIFVGATVLFNVVWRRVASSFDYLLAAINAAAYFGASYGMMWWHLRPWMGAFTLLLALFYGGLAYIMWRRGTENTRLSLFVLSIALVFLTIAVPVQIGNRAWTTVAWAAEGAVLMWLYFALSIREFRPYSYAAFGLVAVRLFFLDTPLNLRAFYPVLNERVLAFVFAIAAMYLTSYIAWRRGQTKPGEDITYYVFLIAASFFSMWLLAAEVIGFANVRPRVPGYLTLAFLGVFAGATILQYLVWRRIPRALDTILIVANAAFYLIMSIVLWQGVRAWIGVFHVFLALCYGGLTYVMLRRSAGNRGFALLALGMALGFLTLAIPVQFGDRFWTTILWAGEMTILVWLSFAIKMPHLRYYSYATFVIMAGRLVFFDTGLAAHPLRPILNERFLAFATGIAGSYAAFYLLWRERERLPDWAAPASTFAVAANFFTLWLLSFELWDYFGSIRALLTPAQSMGPAGNAIRNAQNLSLTALWVIYAAALLIIGIIKRWRQVRLWALGLLAIAVAKVFVYDVFALERGYRIAAFIGLGVTLLVGGYLYQRYGRAIRGFLVRG